MIEFPDEIINNRPKKNIFRKLKMRWKHDGCYVLPNFITGCKNIWYWLPVIYKDRNWDTHYIYEIIKHKLTAQAIYIGDNDRHTRAQEDSRRMQICVKLIQLCQDETYSMEYMDYHKDRTWFTETSNEKYLYNSEILSENFDDYFKKYPLIYKKVLLGEGPFDLTDRREAKKIIAMNIAHINQDRARKLLFKIMEENIEGWWD